MGDSPLKYARRRVGLAGLGALALVVGWVVFPGLPILRGPSANAETRRDGRELFLHEWEPHDAMARGDGLGPVFNARSCAACHFQGGVGGGGGNDRNVTSFEALPTKFRPTVQGGLIHKFAVQNRYFESGASVHDIFPIVPGGTRIVSGCQVVVRDFDPVKTESVNSTALFGAGWIDRLSSKAILTRSFKTSLRSIPQELSSDYHVVAPGRPRGLADGRLGKFGWKAQFATLDEFVAAACANEIGLGNPKLEQATPLVKSGSYPKVDRDLDAAQFGALVAFVETLPRPEEALPDDPRERARALRGKELFTSIGCAVCHAPDMGGLKGVYSDFLLHRLEDREIGGGGKYGELAGLEVPLPDEHPRPDEWKTPPLWGVADSAPYFHDGGSPTLEKAILRHLGDAERVTAAYRALGQEDQSAVIRFLTTLKAPAEAEPAPAVARVKDTLARAR